MAKKRSRRKTGSSSGASKKTRRKKKGTKKTTTRRRKRTTVAKKGTARKKTRSPRRSAKAASSGPVAPDSPFDFTDTGVEDMLLRGENEDLLREHFGDENYAELRQMAREASSRAVRGGPRVLILPGILGSTLGHDGFGPFNDTIWFDPIDIAFGSLRKLTSSSGKPIVPLGVFLHVYLKLKLSLRLGGFDASFYPFDWRKRIADLGRGLRRDLERSSAPVSLVAHSMGGLVARAAIGAGANPLSTDRVPRVITLGTPNHGSFEPVQAVRGTSPSVRKLAVIDLKHDATGLARIFMHFAGLREMLPFAGHLTSYDLYKSAHWPGRRPKPTQTQLNAARRAQADLPEPDDRFRLIVGVNRDTLVGIDRDDETAEFVYERSPSGDGTVPLDSALVPGRPTWYVDEQHGSLPNNGTVCRAVKDLLRHGTTTRLATTWATPRRATTTVREGELDQPVAQRTARTMSQAELREIACEFLSSASSDGPGAIAPPAEPGTQDWETPGYAHEFQHVVVGRKKQHRLEVRLAQGSITDADAQAYVVGIFRDVAPGGAARAIDRELNNAVQEFTERRMFSGDVGEVFNMPAGRTLMYADHIVFAGLGRFDEFNEDVQRLCAENVIRVLSLTKIQDCATVLFGAGSGQDTCRSLQAILRGAVTGLLDSADGRRLRTLTICEYDEERFQVVKEELYRLASTSLFDEIELTLAEEVLEPTRRAAGARVAGKDAEKSARYLLVRTEAKQQTARGQWGGDFGNAFYLRSSILQADGKAAVLSERRLVKTRDFEKLLEQVEHGAPPLRAMEKFGADLATMVLDPRVLEGLAREKDHPLIIVHDGPASRVPWEAVRIGDHAPALAGGMSRRYMAEDLSVAKWLESRRLASETELLLVVDPTSDLPGAVIEGERVQELFSKFLSVRVTRRFQGEATRAQLLEDFASGRYDVVHYAGHAFFSQANPANSGIFCADEKVLSGADLAHLGRVPSLVFFNACEAGRIRGTKKKTTAASRTTTRDKTEDKLQRSVGLAEAFLRGGVAQFIGTYWEVGDTAAKVFGEHFYRAVLEGQPMGAAVNVAREEVVKAKSTDWADYIHYGTRSFQLKVKDGG